MVTAATVTYARVPRCFEGETVVCIGSGPSLTQVDVTWCQGRARVIAVKDAIQFAPWADVLYGAGADGSKFWPRVGPTLARFSGLRYTLDPTAARWATPLRQTGRDGLERDPTGLRIGSPAGSSGYQAINLAVHLGAVRVVLLGYDLQLDATGRDHFVGAPQHRSAVREALPGYQTLVAPLAALQIQILNATRQTALTCFRCCSLEEALA